MPFLKLYVNDKNHHYLVYTHNLGRWLTRRSKRIYIVGYRGGKLNTFSRNFAKKYQADSIRTDNFPDLKHAIKYTDGIDNRVVMYGTGIFKEWQYIDKNDAVIVIDENPFTISLHHFTDNVKIFFKYKSKFMNALEDLFDK
jgi:hypothetical protein